MNTKTHIPNGWDEQQQRKHGWYMHCNINDNSSPTGVNMHTHGIDETYDHMNFQIVARVNPAFAQMIFENIIVSLERGQVFDDNGIYSQILPNYVITFKKVIEGGREALRIILPDKEGNLFLNDLNDDIYKVQWL